MSILRHESNGIEFFTVEATGESGISHRGLAILCGVTHTAINKLVNNLETKQVVKRLQAFADKELHLETSYKKQDGEVKILRADFCAAVIKHYALEGREIAECSMDKFMTLGVNTWIQSITGWKSSTKDIALDFSSKSPDRSELSNLDDVDIASLLKQLKFLRQDLNLVLKHRHIIHNVVEKPVAVDLSLNRIIHTAIHEQAIKLNQAIAALETIQQTVEKLQNFNRQIEQHTQICSSLHQITSLVEQLRQENENQKRVIDRQQVLISAGRKSLKQLTPTEINDLHGYLKPRIEEICAILMKSQQRTGGTRAINTCTKRARIYARYEIGQSLEQIAKALKMPYQTVKSYVKLTKAEIKNYSRQS